MLPSLNASPMFALRRNIQISQLAFGRKWTELQCWWKYTFHMITILLIFQVVPFDKPILVLGLFTLLKLPKRPCKGTLKSELDVWPVVDCLAINHIGRVIFTLLLPTNTNWAILISLSNFFIYLHFTKALFLFQIDMEFKRLMAHRLLDEYSYWELW